MGFIDWVSCVREDRGQGALETVQWIKPLDLFFRQIVR